MGAHNAIFAAEKTGDMMKRIPYPVEANISSAVTVIYLSPEGKEKKISFQIDKELANAFNEDPRNGMLTLLKKNQQVFEEISKNNIPLSAFIDGLRQAILENSGSRKFQVDLTKSDVRMLNVNITTQKKEQFTGDFIGLLGNLLMNLETDRVKEAGNQLALARYLEKKYGEDIVFGAGTVMGGARVKFHVKQGSSREKNPNDLIYSLNGALAKSVEKRILELEDESLKLELFSLLNRAVSLKSVPALACISKFLDAIDGNLNAKSVIDLAISLKSSFYSPVPTVRKSFGTEADYIFANPYNFPAASFAYSKETGAKTEKYGVSYRPDEQGGKLAVFLGLQDLYFSWDLVTVPEFIKFGESNIDILHSGMLYYGGLGIGFDEESPVLSIGAYKLDLSIGKSGLGVESFGLKVPGIYLGILMGIEAIQSAVAYSSADVWEYAVQATLIGAVKTLNPYDPIDRLLTVIDLAVPELTKDKVGMADFFERKKRVDSFIKTGQYNKALQEIEAMLDSSEKSVTKDPVAKYLILLLEDSAIEMEMVHFGSSSPSKAIEKRTSNAMNRLMELNEKEKSSLTEKEWREYLGLSTYLSSKFLITYDQSRGVYVRVPSGFKPKEYETLSRELLLASDAISFHLQGSINYGTAYKDDPMLALGMATLQQVIGEVNPGMFGKYISALSEAKSEKVNSEYVEFCLNQLSSYGKIFGKMQSADPQLWIVLQTLKDGSNTLLKENDMEQKIYNSPVEYFYTTSDPFGFFQTEYWMPVSSLYIWGKQDEEINSLIRSDKKVLELSKAEKNILQRLCKGIVSDIVDYDFSFDLIPKELSFFDFSDEMTSGEIEAEIGKLNEDYGSMGEDYAKLLGRIRDASSNIEKSKEKLNDAVKELADDPSSKKARRKVSEALFELNNEMTNLDSLLSYQVSFFNIQVAKAKHIYKNKDDLDALEELREQAMDDFSTFMGSNQSFESMTEKVLRFSNLSLAVKKIDSAILSESVPKRKNGKNKD